MGTRAALVVSAGQAVAYRLAVHQLDDRLPAGWLAEAAGPAALQDTGRSSAALSLAARVDELVPAEVERALLVDRTLVRLHSLRGVPHVVARRGGAAFGPGALAADEASLRDQLLGDWLAVKEAGFLAREALGLVAGAIAALLADGVPRTPAELRAELRDHVPPALDRPCGRCGGDHVPDRLLHLAGTAGGFCFGRPRGPEAVVVGTEGWLGGPLGPGGDRSRVELARRFLRAYAPTRPEHLAAWAGIGVDDARDRFGRLAFETVDVDLAGRPAWVCEGDVELLADPPSATGVRLLPPDDPFLQQRDRSTLLPENGARRRVWEPAARPGVVLVDGRPAATWWAGGGDDHLALAVEPLGRPLAGRAVRALEEEAAAVARVLGYDDAAVHLAR